MTNQKHFDELLKAFANLLESGSTEGCDGAIVMGLEEFKKAQDALEKITRIRYGEEIEETEEW